MTAIRFGLEGVLGIPIADAVLRTVETELKYVGYLEQQTRQVGRLSEMESRSIPFEFDYRGVPGLSLEIQEKLQRVRPASLGHASRIPGVTPAALALLDIRISLAGVGD